MDLGGRVGMDLAALGFQGNRSLVPDPLDRAAAEDRIWHCAGAQTLSIIQAGSPPAIEHLHDGPGINWTGPRPVIVSVSNRALEIAFGRRRERRRPGLS